MDYRSGTQGKEGREMKRVIIIFLFFCFALPLSAVESKRVILPGASIKGVEATPRMTFIVPWQRSQMKDFPLLPTHSVLDQFTLPLSSRQLEMDLELDRPATATKP